ncbi:MAG: amino acid ABC transporter permease, partial [Candidatus Bipolaricaulota bacterium]
MTTNGQLPPPSERIPIYRWLRKNLFSSWFNGVLTILAATLIVAVVYGLLRWAITSARWEVIPANLKLLLVGTYPFDQLWRVWATLYLIGFLMGFSACLHGGLTRRIAAVAAGAAVLLAALPFPLATRGWLLGAAAAAAAGYGLALLARLAARRPQVPRWIRRT